MDNDEIFSSKKILLKFLGIKENFLYSDFSKKYTKLEKPKKSGGVRLIKPPASKLKNLQRKILDNILYKAPQLPCVYGLSKNKTILQNAKVHQKNVVNQLVNLDIEDFFPSVTPRQVKSVFIRIGFNKENASILTKICTVEDALPQGAPTSPYLASMVCEKMDRKIFAFCKRRKQIYTRYFDDICISGMQITNKDILFAENIIKESGFKSNDKKKQFYDIGTEKIVNGILIRNSDFSVPEEYKKEIKEVFNTYKLDPSDKGRRSFVGKLGFYLHLNRKEAKDFEKELTGELSP